MLSQYSWWDLIKVVLVVLAFYYAYVLLVYYREDIREWISNRGNKPDLQPSTVDPEEVDGSGRYTVSYYGSPDGELPAPSAPPAPAPQMDISLQSATGQALEPDLNGVVIDQEEPADYSIPIVTDTDRPAEQSVADLINAAQRVQANEQGVLIPDDPSDVVAASLAQVINQQQNRNALAGIPFTR